MARAEQQLSDGSLAKNVSWPWLELTLATSFTNIMVTTIQRGAQGAVGTMESYVAQVTRVGRATCAADEAMDKIAHCADEVVYAGSEINSTLGEQTGATAKITQDVECIAQMSEQNSRAASDYANSVETLDKLARSQPEAASRS